MTEAQPAPESQQPESSKTEQAKAPYTWTQTLTELSLEFLVPKGTPPKMMDIRFTATHLYVGVKGQPPILDSDLTSDIVASDSEWQLEGREHLTIMLVKGSNKSWWASPCVGFEEIDVTKIEPPTSKLSDLDGETRALVEKMMYDQEMKKRGLPTSEEKQKQDMMKKFMAQHPEMDFSQTKFG
ncbi:putative Nuclear migration protein nudC [Blattamonas nauphoetae]|uniref:Nuclear migration protein nudC n=1 Tax=Blattamonas nauphoetae TaxID=2049346 RepID=A0ABQ9X3W3_9EUKA|nr:putative Nuclear migration protein nudC [Blattamonas nauphoetae]